MQVLQGMDPDKMIIILPTALVAMYLIISLQNWFCKRSNPYIGLILPAICFIVSTILAVRPLIIANPAEFDGLVSFCIRMWLTFNISTLVFLFPYYKHRKYAKALAEAQAQADNQTSDEVQEEMQNQPEDKQSETDSDI